MCKGRIKKCERECLPADHLIDPDDQLHCHFRGHKDNLFLYYKANVNEI